MLSQLLGTVNRPASKAASPEAPHSEGCHEGVYARYGGDQDRVITEYVKVENANGVARRKNASGYTPEQYAGALLQDGLKKGWLR